MTLPGLYPAIEPTESGMLPVSEGHQIYWEVSGNPDGMPVVFLHGGPGGGAKPIHRQFYDPAFYRIVILDQRGCGRSVPLGGLEGNTTQGIVADLEALRRHLGIETWLVTGGSWGSCLALVYGETYPERCLGFRLRGVFTGRASEIAWWWHSIGVLFPEAFADLAEAVPAAERSDLLAAYHRRTIDPDPAIHLPAVTALKRFSARTSTFRPDLALIADAATPASALPLSRFFTHFCANGFFMPDGQVLRDLGRITHLPCIIVQGRYDVVTPPRTAWEVAQAWPKAELRIVTEANHAELEPDLALAVRQANDDMRGWVSETF
ncbi:MAG TPA: prolyl aminopeptidase [Stellaceae bacterium]|nr:prolyl aminopeptidase [Stellaceae bacterium]